MRWTIIGLLSIVILMTQTSSCGQASFTGNGSSSSNPPAGNNPANPQNGGTVPGGQTPGTTSPIPGAPGSGTPGSGTPGNGNVPSSGTTTPPPTGTYVPGVIFPGTTSPNYSPGMPGTSSGSPNIPGYNPIPSCPGGPCQQGIPTPTYGPIGQASQPNPNSMIFGNSQSFHIGNNAYQSTSCKAQVASLALAGSVYFYQFQVMQDNTSVNINVASLCGVDYTTNVVQLAQNTSNPASPIPNAMGQLMIPKGASSVALPSTVLNKGVYTVYVYSGHGDGVAFPTTDIDDFVIGQVQISGNQAVMPINYGAFK